MTALRQQVQQILAELPLSRRVTLRRPEEPCALLSTNLPFTADEAVQRAYIARMEASGWRVWPQNGWLLMDRPVLPPDAPVPTNLAGECGCCISLLLRHPQEDGDASDAIRALVKAEDEGRAQTERLCSALHADFAKRLRLRQPLPSDLLPYLCHAHGLLID